MIFNFVLCREGGIRTPGPVTVNGFQDRRNRPLCHLSKYFAVCETWCKGKNKFIICNNLEANFIK